MQILVATLRGVVHQQQRAAAYAALLPSLVWGPGYENNLNIGHVCFRMTILDISLYVALWPICVK